MKQDDIMKLHESMGFGSGINRLANVFEIDYWDGKEDYA